MKPLILICSQDAEFYMVLSHILAVEGFASALASDAEEMLELAGESEAHAGIVDCRARNAMADVCRRLRQDGRTSALPLIASIAPGAETQHIALLKSGVDEILVRPFAPAKLLDCLHSKLSGGRLPRPRPEGPASLSYGEVEMDLETHRVRCKGREILLGPIEFKLLRHLLENPGKVLTRDELIEAAWPRNVYVGPRTVDVHISRLRRSLKQSSDLDAIRTVRLGGYALEYRSGAGEQHAAHQR